MANHQQKKTLKICVAVAVLMLIFPPFITQLPHGAVSSEGFGFLLTTKETEISHLSPILNLQQLFAQWCMVAVVGVALWVDQSGDE
jgi:hypothetical protein